MIYFHLEEVEFQIGNEEILQEWLTGVIVTEQKELEEINYIFCSDEYLLKVNQDYLDHDYYTDIITFPYRYQPIKSDIFISVDRVIDNAQKHDSTTSQELHRVMVHGLLHMLGYDDHSDEDVKQMRQKEDHYLAILLQKGQG